LLRRQRPELSPLRTLVICPAFTSTQTPARLQTFTNPSKVITFIVPVVLSNATKKSVPTTPATPAGVRTSNFPSGFGDLLRLRPELSVGQLQLRLLRSGIVLDHFHGRFRSHIQHRPIIQCDARSRIHLRIH